MMNEMLKKRISFLRKKEPLFAQEGGSRIKGIKLLHFGNEHDP